MTLQKQISWNDLSSKDLISYSPLLDDFKKLSFNLVQRNYEDAVSFKIGQRNYDIQLPITFTPYASAQPCSARCWFCSENLRFDNHRGSNVIHMIEDYHLHLDLILEKLIKIPLGLSLSGLEFSDVLDWALKTIQTLLDWERRGGIWTEKALYSNLAGFADISSREILIQQLKRLNLDRLEVSRHHYDDSINNEIMRFRPKQTIQNNQVFIDAITTLQQNFPTRLICILQRNGIQNLDEIYDYLNWAKSIGIEYVIFRELSDISDNRYNENRTFKKIICNKISIEQILAEIISTSDNTLWNPIQIETGYYYWNCMWETPWGIVVFERSDYGFMKKAHDSQTIHKLVYHPNGNLCSDWTPDINVLIEHPHEK